MKISQKLNHNKNYNFRFIILNQRSQESKASKPIDRCIDTNPSNSIDWRRIEINKRTRFLGETERATIIRVLKRGGKTVDGEETWWKRARPTECPNKSGFRQGREKPQRRPYKGGSRKDGRCLAEGGNRGPPPPPPPATEGGDAEKAWHTSPWKAAIRENDTTRTGKMANVVLSVVLLTLSLLFYGRGVDPPWKEDREGNICRDIVIVVVGDRVSIRGIRR